MKRLHLIVSGRVQGVCFRAETQREAKRLGITGWVKNLDDGSVEAVAEGEPALLGQFLAWCAHGPSAARVLKLRPSWQAPTGEFTGFSIL